MALNDEDLAALLAISPVLRTMTTATFWKRLSGYLKNCAGVFYRIKSLHERTSSAHTEAWKILGWTELNDILLYTVTIRCIAWDEIYEKL